MLLKETKNLFLFYKDIYKAVSRVSACLSVFQRLIVTYDLMRTLNITVAAMMIIMTAPVHNKLDIFTSSCLSKPALPRREEADTKHVVDPPPLRPGRFFLKGSLLVGPPVPGPAVDGGLDGSTSLAR